MLKAIQFSIGPLLLNSPVLGFPIFASGSFDVRNWSFEFTLIFANSLYTTSS